MNRESIIILICIGVVVLFYLFQVKTNPEEQVGLIRKPTVQISDDIISKALQQVPKEVDSTTPDLLDNKGN